MDSSMLRDLIIAATILDGILAGSNVDRLVVQMPAWRKVGVQAWAAYSRHADLGNGLIFFPLVAIGGALTSIAAAVIYHINAGMLDSASAPIDLAALLVAGGLLTTIGAAPKMLSLRRIGDDPVALERAFTGFDRWGTVRAVFQILAFGANVWSLVAVAGK